MNLRGLWTLTWVELKIFLREPLGALGTIVIPVLVFIFLGRAVGKRLDPSELATSGFLHVGLPVLASLLIAISSVLWRQSCRSIAREASSSACAQRHCVPQPFLQRTSL